MPANKFAWYMSSCVKSNDLLEIASLVGDRPIPPSTSSGVLLAISLDSREAVEAMNAAAAAHGGEADINPKRGLGFMYNRNLADPDGHVWEAVWMDPSAIPAG